VWFVVNLNEVTEEKKRRHRTEAQRHRGTRMKKNKKPRLRRSGAY